jgi:glycosyltransferase involved in cell wall biosynthesis
VVVPLYQGEPTIAETLTSLERQSSEAFEVVVVDDGSTDAGPDIVREHPVAARLVRQARSGVAVARNRGVARSSATWVTFLDQDDLWHPSRLARLIDRLHGSDAPPMLATTHWTFADPADRAGLEAVGTDVMVDRWVPRDQVLPMLLDGSSAVSSRSGHADRLVDVASALTAPITLTPTFVAAREHLVAAGLFPTHVRTLDDWWLTVTAARLAPFPLVDEPTVYYRLHRHQTSNAAAIALPFLSAQLALRYGGTAVEPTDALAGRPQPQRPVNNVLEHQVGLLVTSPAWAQDQRLRRAVSGMVAAVDPSSDLGRRLRGRVRRAEVRRRAPWLAAAARRLHR